MSTYSRRVHSSYLTRKVIAVLSSGYVMQLLKWYWKITKRKGSHYWENTLYRTKYKEEAETAYLFRQQGDCYLICFDRL